MSCHDNQRVEIPVRNAQHTFLIVDNACVQMTLLVDQAVDSVITIICRDNVDLILRALFLFSGTASIQLKVVMCGQKSNVVIDGISILSADDRLQITTEQIHCGPENVSKLRLHGIIAGSASVMHNGTIMIAQSAPRTYALQQNKNIVLSKQARAVAIPNIEVLHHDVQCFHGAAVGRFDHDQIAYLQSRGLDATVIKQLLVQGHFGFFLDQYDQKDSLLAQIYTKI